MRPIREAIQKKRAAGSSMGLRLLLYWFTMVLLLMAAILSTLMATGVLSHPAHQLSGTLDIQQRNTYAALDSQMDALTAQSMAMSEKLGKELDAFLAAKGIAFDELNNNPDTIAGLEKRLYTPLSNTLGAASCSGIFFGLNVTANTSLPNAEDFRAGLYLRYSGLQPTGRRQDQCGLVLLHHAFRGVEERRGQCSDRLRSRHRRLGRRCDRLR